MMTYPILEALNLSGNVGKELNDRLRYCKDFLHQMISRKNQKITV